MKIIFFGTIAILGTAVRLAKQFNISMWKVQIVLFALAIIMYGINSFLIRHYVLTRTPELASKEEILPGVQAWELTAGLGVVPKWVSVLGLLSISATLAAVIPWIMRLFGISMV